jgi:hypothetical protein
MDPADAPDYLSANLNGLATLVLSTDDRQRIEGWMAHKWALTSVLPPGHPYKNNPPS